MRGRIGWAMLVLSCGFNSTQRIAAAQGAVVADSLLKDLLPSSARRPIPGSHWTLQVISTLTLRKSPISIPMATGQCT